ncbi:hypothetical protein ACHAWF_011651 [Thalassiosira exigua]
MVATISMFILLLINLCEGWTSVVTSHRPSSFGCTKTKSASSTSLHYRSGYDEGINSNPMTNNSIETKVSLQAALQEARDADREYGICTPESVRAWKVVDDIYSSSNASRQVQDNVKKVFGEENSVWGYSEWSYTNA